MPTVDRSLYACLVTLVWLAGCRGCVWEEGQADSGVATPALGPSSSPTDASSLLRADVDHDGAAAASSAGLGRLEAGVDAGASGSAGCPTGMVAIRDFCIDQYEAYVVVLDHKGKEHFHSPYEKVAGKRVRAKVRPGAIPQAYISQVEAAKACKEAGKRLCERDEFVLACRGPEEDNLYPYGGRTRRPGACNEGKGSSVMKKYGNDVSTWTYDMFNDPELNKEDNTLARGGAYKKCVSPFGVYDLVGNLHEWGADPADDRGRGRFRGGFYGDAEVNGHGCLYVTKAHEMTYHDYSTGFRCCKHAE